MSVAWLVALFGLIPSASAGAAVPERGTVLFPGVSGTALQDSLRIHFKPSTSLGYGAARDVMYTSIDNQGGSVTGVYTGFTIFIDPSSTSPRAEALSRGINAEHTWPQSRGAGNFPARSDLHHLFPSQIDANSARGSFPFDEIPDADSDFWYRLNQRTITPELAFLDEYSELDMAHPDGRYQGRFEPREGHKGNTARAIFYFYTIYRNEALSGDPAFFDVQKSVLRSWEDNDPVDAREYERTCAIAAVQDGKANPFVIDPTLVTRAYFDEVPVVLTAFAAHVSNGVVRLRWSTSDETGHLGFNVFRRSAGARWVRLNAGLVTGSRDYVFLDDWPGVGVFQYFIESVGRLGETQRFGPLLVEVGGAPVLAVSATPNPSSGPVAFHVSGSAGGRARLEVFDVAGRRVYAADTTPSAPAGFRWAVTPAPGLYLYRVLSGGATATGRFTIVR